MPNFPVRHLLLLTLTLKAYEKTLGSRTRTRDCLGLLKKVTDVRQSKLVNCWHSKILYLKSTQQELKHSLQPRSLRFTEIGLIKKKEQGSVLKKHRMQETQDASTLDKSSQPIAAGDFTRPNRGAAAREGKRCKGHPLRKTATTSSPRGGLEGQLAFATAETQSSAATESRSPRHRHWPAMLKQGT